MRAHHPRLLPVRASGKRNRAEPNLIFNRDSKNQVSAESLEPIQEANQEIKRGTMRHASGGRAEFGPSRFGKRSAVFDKCSVLEIKDSALFLAFAFQDIKDIKRRRTLPRSASRVGGTQTLLSACLQFGARCAALQKFANPTEGRAKCAMRQQLAEMRHR